MTDLRKAAEMALDAMLSEYSTGGENKYSPWDVIEALRQALAQPEQDAVNQSDCGHKEYKPLCQMCVSKKQPEQEPVAWLVSDAQGRYATIRDPAPYGEEVYEPLYAAPPKREWQELTDEDWHNLPTSNKQGCERDAEIFNWIEDKLKEKNT